MIADRSRPVTVDASALVLTSLFVILVVTTFPYAFGAFAAGTSVEPRSSGGTPALLWHARWWWDVAGNLGLFLPWGFAWGGRLLRRREAARPGLGILGVLLLTLALSCAAEALQSRLPGRDPRWHDVIANLLGAAGGLLLFRACGLRLLEFAGRATRLATRLPPTLLALAVLLWAVLAADFSAGWQSAAHTSNWNHSHPLLVGNEGSGDRPWKGVLWRVQFGLGAMSDTEVFVDEAAGPEPIGAARPLLALGFPSEDLLATEGALSLSMQWRGSPAPLPGDPSRGVTFDGTRWMASDGPATDLNRALAEAPGFTLGLDAATLDLQQTGPARIVSLSYDIWHRNLSLCQQGDALVVRLRTPASGRNGSDPEWVLPGVFRDTQRHRYVLSYDGTTARMFVDGLRRGGDFRLTPGGAVFGGWLDPRAELLWGWQVLLLMVLCLPPAKWAALLAAHRGWRCLGRGAALITPVAVEFWTAQSHPRAWQPAELAVGLSLAVFSFWITGRWLRGCESTALPEVS